MLLLLLFVLVLLLIAFVSWFSFSADRKLIDMDGPAPYPLIGNGLELAVKSTAFLPVLKRLEDNYNQNCLIYLFSDRFIVTSDPKFIEEIVSSTKIIEKARSYDFAKPWLGEGLLTSAGPRWRAHRKFLTPAFHFNILQHFLPIFCKNGKILTEKLQKLSEKESVIDMFPLMALIALDNVTESIMGVSFNAQSDKESAFVKAVDVISTIVATRIRNPFVAPDVVFNLLPYKNQQTKALKVLHDQTTKVINARREELKNTNVTELTLHSAHGIKNRHAFLDLLLLAEVDGKKIKDEWIREEVDTFMFEGHDTTTSGITFCLYCLAKNQDVQEKVLLEQKSIFGDKFDRDPTYSELQQMKYLEMVIKESLRLYPSVPLIGRNVVEDTVINGMRVPKNTSIVIDFFNMQRHHNVYDDPMIFKPERFEATSRNPFTWLAFSAGPRNCIGQKFAMMEMKVTISELVKSFRIFPSDEEPKLTADLILRSENGVKLNLKPRLI